MSAFSSVHEKKWREEQNLSTAVGKRLQYDKQVVSVVGSWLDKSNKLHLPSKCFRNLYKSQYHCV